ncbi:hypothetical protein LCGC14_1842010 [marine sediment metagenome]|uniref:Uncharacterized protein n=1 Tax=marine sediment metagenome TaxID=412755 RepID=A0A0F9GCX6_9ZZZZ
MVVANRQTVSIGEADYRALDTVRLAMEKERGRCVSFAEVVSALIHEAGWAIRRNGSNVTILTRHISAP